MTCSFSLGTSDLSISELSEPVNSCDSLMVALDVVGVVGKL